MDRLKHPVALWLGVMVLGILLVIVDGAFAPPFGSSGSAETGVVGFIGFGVALLALISGAVLVIAARRKP